jgi:hypothetical protein
MLLSLLVEINIAVRGFRGCGIFTIHLNALVGNQIINRIMIACFIND